MTTTSKYTSKFELALDIIILYNIIFGFFLLIALLGRVMQYDHVYYMAAVCAVSGSLIFHKDDIGYFIQPQINK